MKLTITDNDNVTVLELTIYIDDPQALVDCVQDNLIASDFIECIECRALVDVMDGPVRFCPGCGESFNDEGASA